MGFLVIACHNEELARVAHGSRHGRSGRRRGRVGRVDGCEGEPCARHRVAPRAGRGEFNISSAAAATQRFFMCLEKGAGSAAGKWKLGVKANIERITFERAKAAGEQLDGSAEPIYLEHVEQMVASYARKGSAEGSSRKLALLMLWQAARRSCEVAWSTHDSLRWDVEFKSLFIEILQSKTSKMKLVAFVSGANRHADLFLALGDHLTMPPEVPVYDPDAPSWILPVLQGTSSPAHAIGTYVKQLLPKGPRRGRSKPETPCHFVSDSSRGTHRARDRARQVPHVRESESYAASAAAAGLAEEHPACLLLENASLAIGDGRAGR